MSRDWRADAGLQGPHECCVHVEAGDDRIRTLEAENKRLKEELYDSPMTPMEAALRRENHALRCVVDAVVRWEAMDGHFFGDTPEEGSEVAAALAWIRNPTPVTGEQHECIEDREGEE